jgi:TorA maturation chaperone TorD
MKSECNNSQIIANYERSYINNELGNEFQKLFLNNKEESEIFPFGCKFSRSVYFGTSEKEYSYFITEL